MNPSWGLPAVWKQRLAKGIKGRGQPLATSFPRSACAQAAKISGEGCSLGSHSPVFQRHRWALAFLTTQTDPDIRAAGEWDFARIQLGKNHITKKTPPNQNKAKNQQDTHWSRVDEDIQHVPTPSKGWDEPENNLYYTAAAQTAEQAWRGTGSCARLQLQAFPHFATVTTVLFMPPHSC